MHTIAFIGSDKNAGKTTVFNFVCSRLGKKMGSGKILLATSIGINGELLDNYEYAPKPNIHLPQGSAFITAHENLKSLTGHYEIIHVFSPPHFKKYFVLGRCLIDLTLVLEGPNEKHELLEIKQFLRAHFPDGHLLIDGSIDRQFVAHPDISDSFYFALLKSDRPEQLKKSQDLLLPLSIPLCAPEDSSLLREHLTSSTKSLLFDLEKRTLLYHGSEIPFLDRLLHEQLVAQRHGPVLMYLGGALSKGLYSFLAPLKNLKIVLHNFTLFQNISVYQQGKIKFHPKLYLLHPVVVEKIFLNEQAPADLPIPAAMALHNLYREDLDEIRI
jgi:hypothetical protein